MSERDGWNHLYLYDGATGRVKNQITKGEWVVRGVVEGRRRRSGRSGSRASGMYPGKDPYFVHYYRINFDGTDLTTLTEARRQPRRPLLAGHEVLRRHVFARRPAAGLELRRTSDRQARHGRSRRPTSRRSSPRAGSAPEVFAAKGRDGKTDIWGVIVRPDQLRSDEEISGDREHLRRAARLVRAEDRSAPVSAACMRAGRARLYRRADRRDGDRTGRRRSTTSRGRTSATPASPIGSSGTRRSPRSIRSTTSRASASTAARRADRMRSAALLFHPRLLQGRRCRTPAVTTTAWTRSGGTSSGWDGRSDRSTRQSSNVDNAQRLQGKLLLIVGELDTNVDPASTMQVVNALIKANKISICSWFRERATVRYGLLARWSTASGDSTTSSSGTCWRTRRRTGIARSRPRQLRARASLQSLSLRRIEHDLVVPPELLEKGTRAR